MPRSAPLLGCVALAAVLTACGTAPSVATRRLDNQAFMALGSRPILHVIAEEPTGNTYVDLKTGARTESYDREEIWTDSQGQHVRLVASQSGRVIGDELLPEDAGRFKAAFPPDPASSLAKLWLDIRQALKADALAYVGRGEVRGRPVDWLEFGYHASRPGLRTSTEIAVDSRTHGVVLFRNAVNGHNFDEPVIVDRTVPDRGADFRRQGPFRNEDDANSGTGTGGWSSSGIYATINSPPATSIRAPWLTAGTTAGGLKFSGVNGYTASKKIDGKKRTVHGVELVYGPLTEGLVAGDLATTVDELPEPDQSTDWRDIPAAAIEIQTYVDAQSGASISQPKWHTSRHRVWNGYFKKDGFYIGITTYQGKAALLHIARALHPAAARSRG